MDGNIHKQETYFVGQLIKLWKDITLNKFLLYIVMIFYVISINERRSLMKIFVIENLKTENRTEVCSEEFYEDLEYYEDSIPV